MESNKKLNDAKTAIRFIDGLYPIIASSNQINRHVEDELDKLKQQFETYIHLQELFKEMGVNLNKWDSSYDLESFMFCSQVAKKHLSSIYRYIVPYIVEGKIKNVRQELRIIHWIIKKWDKR